MSATEGYVRLSKEEDNLRSPVLLYKYPKSILYYAYNEDTNPFVRVKNYVQKSEKAFDEYYYTPPQPNAYAEEKTRIQYLQTKPTCFIVFGKPGLPTDTISELLAKSLNKVLISPLEVLKNTIEKSTKYGKYVESVLRAGEEIDRKIVWELIESRATERDVQHRGYVVEGVPMIPNESEEYNHSSALSCSNNSTDDTSSNGNSSISEEESEQFISTVINSCKCYSCRIPWEIKNVFNNWHLKPDVIIGLTCPRKDVPRVHNRFEWNVRTGNTRLIEERQNNQEMPHALKADKFFVQRLSCNTENVDFQCEVYEKYALKCIDNVIIKHNPQYVITLDGRYSPQKIFQTIQARLKVIAIQVAFPPVLMVSEIEKQNKGDDETDESDSDDEDIEEEKKVLSKDSLESDDLDSDPCADAFQIYSTIGIPNPKFRWQLSPWVFNCPVELARGHRQRGDPKFAVRFMNRIFFLSSQETSQLFIENPRPYLSPPNPRPSCRIAVLGPPFSGKTNLCEELRGRLGGTIIDASFIYTVLLQYKESTLSSDEQYEEPPKVNRRTKEDITVTEKIDFILENIKKVPQEYLNDYYRQTYIIDNTYNDAEFWKRLFIKDFPFDDIIILYEEDPYELLINNWIYYQEHEQIFVGDLHDQQEDHPDCSKNVHSDEEMKKNHIQLLDEFECSRLTIQEILASQARLPILCDLKKIDNLCEYVMNNIEDRYKWKATRMTQEEIELENTSFENNPRIDQGVISKDVTESNEDKIEDDEMIIDDHEVQAKLTKMEDSFDDCRFLGDCSIYCPVALMKHGVLWKGTEKYSAKFSNKMFLCSNFLALNEFVENPSEFQVPFENPLPKIPPMRICIIGSSGCGKSTISQALAAELEFASVDFFSQLDKYLIERGFGPYGEIFFDNDIDIKEMEETIDKEYPDPTSERNNFNMSEIQECIRKYRMFGGKLPNAIANECVMQFFKFPYNKCGMIVDSFPNYAEDFQLLMDNFAIPDLIIYLKCSEENVYERTVQKFLKFAEAQRPAVEAAAKQRYLNACADREARKTSFILNEIKKKNERKETAKLGRRRRKPCPKKSELNEDETNAMLTSDLGQSLANTFDLEFPEPVYEFNWDMDSFLRRLQLAIGKSLKNTPRNMMYLRSTFTREGIPWINIDANDEPDTIVSTILKEIKLFTIRDPVIFERTYEVSVDLAEKLLNCGFYFLSSLGRLCPVQLYYKQIPYHMYLSNLTRGLIFPVLHRQYIYFLDGKEALLKFRKIPLKFVKQCCKMSYIPASFSIIGPPKCGKSTLAKRLSDTYGFKLITRGKALRFALTNFAWTHLGHCLEKTLRSGELATVQHIVHSVKLILSNAKVLTQGYVLDGFPENQEEAEAFALASIRPFLVLDLKAGFEFTWDCLEFFRSENPEQVAFPNAFLRRKYTFWKNSSSSFRKWVTGFAGNIVEIEATRCKFGVWRETCRVSTNRFFEIPLYFYEDDIEKAYDLKYLCISPSEFRQRQSKFQIFCPICLSIGKLVNCKLPFERNGLVQFRQYFYWMCENHHDIFINDSLQYFVTFKNLDLPKDRPRIINETVDVEHACWVRRLQSGGFCHVTYIDNLPKQEVIKGNADLGVLYKDKVYLFCSVDCRTRFLQIADKYTSIKEDLTEISPDIPSLPTLRFLQHTVATMVIEAIKEVRNLRPKLPGLTSSASAAVFIGSFLKANNMQNNLTEVKLYKIVKSRIESRCKFLSDVTKHMKTTLNPYIIYIPRERGDDMDPTKSDTSLVLDFDSPSTILYD